MGWYHETQPNPVQNAPKWGAALNELWGASFFSVLQRTSQAQIEFGQYTTTFRTWGSNYDSRTSTYPRIAGMSDKESYDILSEELKEIEREISSKSRQNKEFYIITLKGLLLLMFGESIYIDSDEFMNAFKCHDEFIFYKSCVCFHFKNGSLESVIRGNDYEFPYAEKVAINLISHTDYPKVLADYNSARTFRVEEEKIKAEEKRRLYERMNETSRSGKKRRREQERQEAAFAHEYLSSQAKTATVSGKDSPFAALAALKKGS